MKKKSVMIIAFFFAGALIFSLTTGFKSLQDNKPWPVPDNYKNMKNPVASNATSIAEGKTLYSTHCKSCHGAKGLGDGNKAAQLKTEARRFFKI